MGNKKAPEGANKIFQADNTTISKECQLESWKKFDNNAVKPRLTEMKARGTVEVIGKAYDALTERHVSVYRRT